MLRLELQGRQVVQAHMRPDGVVILPPSLDDDLGLSAGAEPLDAQALIAELAVEGFARAVLPRLAGVDQGGIDAVLCQPPEDGRADELGAIIGSQERRCAMQRDQASKDIDDAAGADAAGDIDSQALMGEFIDDRQALELLAVGAGIEDEVVGPDMIRGHWRQWPGAGRRTAPRALARQLQAGLAPKAFGSASAHGHAFALQEDADAAIAVAGIL